MECTGGASPRVQVQRVEAESGGARYKSCLHSFVIGDRGRFITCIKWTHSCGGHAALRVNDSVVGLLVQG